MADVNQKVLALVRREIEKDPHVPNDLLAREAAAIDRSVRKLSKLQFHGTYRLTAARQIAAEGRKSAKRPTTGTFAGVTSRHMAPAARTSSSTANPDAGRTAVLTALFEFAGEVAQAESKADVVRVLSRIDRHVDRVVAAAASS